MVFEDTHTYTNYLINNTLHVTACMPQSNSRLSCVCMLSNTMLCYVQNSRRVKVLSESENHEDHIRYSCHESTRCLVPTKRDFVAYVHSAYIVSQGRVTLQCSVGFVESQTIILLEWCTQQGIHLQFKLHVLSLIFILRKTNLSKQAYLLIVRSAHKCLESQEQRYLTLFSYTGGSHSM